KEREMFKICAGCELEMPIARRECPECGFQFEPAECVIAEALPDMEKVEFGFIIPSEPEWYPVIDWSIEIHTSRKNGKNLGKVTFIYPETEYKTGRVFMWLCFADHYSGFAVSMAKDRWSEISHDTFPISVEDFMESHFDNPIKILLDINGKYPELKEVFSKWVEIEKNYYDPDDDVVVVEQENAFVVPAFEDDEIPF
ncbi:MAG: hypothetical protein DRH26_00005, partial [Deltaproteobacteria bacterium]